MLPMPPLNSPAHSTIGWRRRLLNGHLLSDPMNSKLESIARIYSRTPAGGDRRYLCYVTHSRRIPTTQKSTGSSDMRTGLVACFRNQLPNAREHVSSTLQ